MIISKAKKLISALTIIRLKTCILLSPFVPIIKPSRSGDVQRNLLEEALTLTYIDPSCRKTPKTPILNSGRGKCPSLTPITPIILI